MSKWRLAKSLERLRWEVNTLYPKRSKASDGAKGDAAHAKRASDHNPNKAGVVCAIDITHDPNNGADMQAIADYILKYPHPALAYVIFNRRIARRIQAWDWREYTGSNPHTKHMHVSVVQDPARYDIEGMWLKNFEQEEEPMTTKLMVNDRKFDDIIAKESNMMGDRIYVHVEKFVRAINGVNGVKASLVWNAKTKTAKLYVGSVKRM